MYILVPFQRVLPQWQFLYLFSECTIHTFGANMYIQGATINTLGTNIHTNVCEMWFERLFNWISLSPLVWQALLTLTAAVPCSPGARWPAWLWALVKRGCTSARSLCPAQNSGVRPLSAPQQVRGKAKRLVLYLTTDASLFNFFLKSILLTFKLGYV